MSHHLISLTIFLPLLGAFIQSFLPKNKSKWVALGASVAASICGIFLVLSLQPQSAELQATEVFPWIGSYAISYDMAVDGLNALLILLVAILFPILISSEWNQKAGSKGMHGLFLVLQTSLSGAVCAQDLFLQFFFWSLSSLPFYFLIGIWGGEQREKAALRTTVAAFLGNALVFCALILIYYSIDPHSFSLRELAGGRLGGKNFELLGQEFSISTVAFALMSVGLSLRAPVWPIQGWFTDAASEAPFSVFVALCAGVVPTALYIFMRICYLLFPETLSYASKIIIVVGTANLLFGGICAVSQKKLRGLLAFVCVSGAGLILMGIGSLSTAGVVGSVYQLLILGLGLAGFGLFSGVISERTGQSDFLNDKSESTLGGIAIRAPLIAIVAGVAVASLLGFPGFGGFVGNALILIGSYSIHPVTVAVATSALLLASYYLFGMYRSVFLGKSSIPNEVSLDLTFREQAYMLPIVFSLLFFGIYPKPLIELIRPTVLTLLSTVK